MEDNVTSARHRPPIRVFAKACQQRPRKGRSHWGVIGVGAASTMFARKSI
jgi:hypothetical protein